MELQASEASQNGSKIQVAKQNIISPKILVVEDDLTQIPIWNFIIEKSTQHATVSWAESFEKADDMIVISKLTGNPFDLVISDLFLSGSLTGADLWKRFKKMLQGHFLLVSSIDPVKLQKHLGGFEAPAYLQKPLDLSETIQTVHGLLHRSL